MKHWLSALITVSMCGALNGCSGQSSTPQVATTASAQALAPTQELTQQAATPAPSDPLAGVLAPGAAVEQVASGLALGEGPAYFPDGRLIISDVSNNVVYAFDASGKRTDFLNPSNYANGHVFDGQGRLIQAEHGGRVTRVEADGSVTVLAEAYEDKPLNSPNDVAVHSDGTIWFTDPPFGLPQRKAVTGRSEELGFSGVYRLDPATGAVTLLTRDLVQPNGIGFSPDEQTLYVSDSATGRITAFPIQADGTLGQGRSFGDSVDGLKVDVEGRVWGTARDGISITSANGTELGTIPLPEDATNVAFGGANGQTLYITTFSGVYKIETQTRDTRFLSLIRHSQPPL
jgi:gluconolactonase